MEMPVALYSDKRNKFFFMENGKYREATSEEDETLRHLNRTGELKDKVKAIPPGLNVQPGRNTKDWESFVANVLAVDQGQAAKYLAGRGYQVQVDPATKKLAVSTDKGRNWYHVKPDKLDSQSAIEAIGGWGPAIAVLALTGQPAAILKRVGLAAAMGGGLELARQGIGQIAGVPQNMSPTAIAQQAGFTAAGQGASELATGGLKLASGVIEKARAPLKRGFARAAGFGDVGPIQETEIFGEAIKARRGQRGTESSFYQLAQRVIREVDKPAFNPEAAEAAGLARASDRTVDLRPVLRQLQASAKAAHPSQAGREHVSKTLDGFIQRVHEGTGGPPLKTFEPGLPAVGPEQPTRFFSAGTSPTPATAERGLGGGIMGLPEEVSGPAGRGTPGVMAMQDTTDYLMGARKAPSSPGFPGTAGRMSSMEGTSVITDSLSDFDRRLSRVPMSVAQDLKMFLQEEAAPSSAVAAVPDSAASALGKASSMLRQKMEAGMAGVTGKSGRPFHQLNRIASRKNELRHTILFKSGERNEADQTKRLEGWLKGMYKTTSQADRNTLRQFEEIGKATGVPRLAMSGTIRKDTRAGTITEALASRKEGLQVTPRLYTSANPASGFPGFMPSFLRIQPSSKAVTAVGDYTERAGTMTQTLLDAIAQRPGSLRGGTAAAGQAAGQAMGSPTRPLGPAEQELLMSLLQGQGSQQP